MPVLKNQRHELFAQGLFAGLSADEAYVKAGFQENRGNASRLKSNESIQNRVRELQGGVAKKAILSKAWVIERLIDVHNSAIEGNPVLDRYGHPTGKTIVNHSGANKALELLGKEIGMFVERKDVALRRIADTPREELEAQLAELESGEVGASETRH